MRRQVMIKNGRHANFKGNSGMTCNFETCLYLRRRKFSKIFMHQWGAITVSAGHATQINRVP